jgi:hypothetical protein
MHPENLVALAAVAPVLLGLALVAALQRRYGLALGAALIAIAFIVITLVYR